MRTILIRSLFVGAAVTSVAQAQDGGFTRDVDHSSLSQVFATTTFGELAVGDSAYARPWTFCWRENKLHLIATFEIDTANEWSVNLKVTRKTGGAVEVETELGARADMGDLEGAVLRFAAGESCDERLDQLSFNPGSVALLKVETINGFASLSDLAASIAEAAEDRSGAAPAEETAVGDRDVDVGWIVTRENDEITDEPNVFIARLAEDSVPGMFGNTWTPTLMLRCLRNTSAVIVRLEDFLVRDTVPVSYRFDDAAPKDETWSVATNRKAIGLWSGGKSIPFIKELVSAERLTMRITTDDGVYTFSFDLSEAHEHVEELATACNWTL